MQFPSAMWQTLVTYAIARLAPHTKQVVGWYHVIDRFHTPAKRLSTAYKRR